MDDLEEDDVLTYDDIREQAIEITKLYLKADDRNIELEADVIALTEYARSKNAIIKQISGERDELKNDLRKYQGEGEKKKEFKEHVEKTKNLGFAELRDRKIKDVLVGRSAFWSSKLDNE